MTTTTTTTATTTTTTTESNENEYINNDGETLGATAIVTATATTTRMITTTTAMTESSENEYVNNNEEIRGNNDEEAEGGTDDSDQEWARRAEAERGVRAEERRNWMREWRELRDECKYNMLNVNSSDTEDEDTGQGAGHDTVRSSLDGGEGRGAVYVSNFFRRNSSHAPPPFGDPPD
jgi:hypothetical protein